MSTYVMSDVHGRFDTFSKMLELIDLKDDDTLYVLGDVIDRGPDGIKIIQKIMTMPNVELFLGNHELLMLDAIQNEYEIKHKDRHDTDDIDVWLDPCNGGRPTYDAYKSLPLKKRKEIVAFLNNSWVVKRVNIGKKSYHLSHAYTCGRKIEDGFRVPDMKREEIWTVVWQSVFEYQFRKLMGERLFPNKKTIYVGGHIFTQRLDCTDESGRGVIYHDKNYHGYHVYNIDCGMALMNKASQLACLRLDDESEFYVPLVPDGEEEAE